MWNLIIRVFLPGQVRKLSFSSAHWRRLGFHFFSLLNWCGIWCGEWNTSSLIFFYAVNKLLFFKALKSVLWALNCFSSGQSHWKLEANLWSFACMNSGDSGFLVLCGTTSWYLVLFNTSERCIDGQRLFLRSNGQLIC